ncbi:hypothetical protein C8J57DRAFT_1586316 [Mycena rebaudengoi]|nr:hypothetical protein C8J57DRAFT_1586316 [Mycena rebaudengoi]
MEVDAADDAPMSGAFGLSAAPTTPPANKFDFGSGGATPSRFEPARAANGGNGTNGANGTGCTNGGGTTDRTKAEILAELDRRVFGGSAIPIPSPIWSRPIRPLGSARKSGVEAWNASLDVGGGAGGFLNNNHIGGKPPAAPGRFDKAHTAAFARMESIATTGRGAQVEGERGGWAIGKRVRVESVADAYSNINTNTDANTNANPNTNTNTNNTT